MRTPCVEGPDAANGLLFIMQGFRGCAYALKGTFALAPAGADWAPPAADNRIDARLVRGPAFETSLAENGNEAWTHWRGNAGHTGEAATAPRTPLALGWERKLGGTLTPPSFGGGLAYVGSHDGFIWALNQRTGEVRWKSLCGAGVKVTPTYWRGRLLVGSDDGCVYCLDAGTSQLAWRFQAAPEARYVNVTGHLGSDLAGRPLRLHGMERAVGLITGIGVAET